MATMSLQMVMLIRIFLTSNVVRLVLLGVILHDFA